MEKKTMELLVANSDVNSTRVVCNPQVRYSTPKKLVCKTSKETITPRKSPRLIEKGKNKLSECLTKMVLDFERHVEEHTLGTSEKINDDEAAVNAAKEPVLHLENLDADDCHPVEQPWSQPLMYSEGEDDEDWQDFLQNFSMKSSGAEEDSENENKGDNYDQLLMNEVDAQVPREVNEPLVDAWLEDNKRNESCPNTDGYGLEIVDRPIPNTEVKVVTNGSVRLEMNDSDFEDFFASDLVDPEELFPDPEHDEHVVVENLIEEGLEFPDKASFQRHLRSYCVSTRTICRFTKSDNVRIKAVCKGFGEPILCPWYISARKIPGEPTWRIRDFHQHHTCIGDAFGRNSSANHEFVAEQVIKKLKETHGNIIPKPRQIVDHFWRSHNTCIPYHVAWKARNNVLERINGSYDESFRLIPSLCEMIARTNPGSIAKFTYGRKDNCFESVTISFDAPMRAFSAGCRNVVGLDGCHLKGKYGGCLLSATALDGQNGLVPLGIMVCRNECAENWFLFLKHLKTRLVDHPVEPINFISDRQKGLREAVSELFPTSPHRFCFRHMYKNFKTHFKGSKLHGLFWNAARAYKAKHFKAHMDSLMAENVAASEYLMGEDPKNWCRAFFDQKSSCEHLSNNFSESFNNMISNIREKPVCKLVLMYGQLVMGLFYKRRNTCVGWDDRQLVPTAKKLLKNMLKNTGDYKVEGAVIEKLYEVTSVHKTVFSVDLAQHTCSCVQWQLRGFPCQHAVCALQQIRPNWVEYCARYYSVENYRKTYAPGMVPLEGPEDWEEPRATIVPHILIRKQGRPKKNRRKAFDETLTEKKARRCSKCKMTGHNQRTCGGGVVGSNPKKKRARSEIDGQSYTQSGQEKGVAANANCFGGAIGSNSWKNTRDEGNGHTSQVQSSQD